MESFYDLFKAASVRYPASAIHFPDEGKHFSYAEFLAGVDACAGELTARGIDRGDRVALFGQNTSYWMQHFFALFKIGAVAVPISAKSVEEDIRYIIDTAGVKLLLRLDDGPKYVVCPPVRRPGPDRSDPATGDLQLIMFTSGTTANPKGVMHTAGSLRNSAFDYMRTIRLDERDVMLLNLPISHCYGCVLNCCSFFLAGASMVVSRSYTPRGTLRLIEKYRCTVLNMVPTMYQLLFTSELTGRYDLSSVRKAVVGGSYTSQELVDSMGGAFGPQSVLCGYGMTECASWAIAQSFDDPASERGNSAGKPVGNMEARIAPGYDLFEDGIQEGELCLRGKGMMKGYLDDAMTAASYDEEGWFHTGDVARRDAVGRYWIVDRCKDMIIKGGDNISPKHVELVLDGFRGIEGSQVVGIPDAVYGERIVAVLTRSQAEKTDLKALVPYLTLRLARNRRPDFFVALDEIPVTGVGKVNKQAIRKLVGSHMDDLQRNRINYL